MLSDLQGRKQVEIGRFHRQFPANAILANPAVKLKTFKDHVGEVKSYDEALKAALAPMKGKSLMGARSLATGLSRNMSTRLGMPGSSRKCGTTRSHWSSPRSDARISSIPHPSSGRLDDLVDIDDLIKPGPGLR